jgi:hypothetical protein
MQSTSFQTACLFILSAITAAVAGDSETVSFGAAEVYEEFQLMQSGVAILTLNAVVPETNNSLRGLRNSDPRRLVRLGQLIYQCKLMLHKPAEGEPAGDRKTPVLVSSNYSLFTGVDLSLSPGEQAGIRVRALGNIDEQSLFTPTLGEPTPQQEAWQNIGEGPAVELRQLDVNLLKEIDLAGNTESIDIVIRFPVFQLQQPVNQWSYNFLLADFRKALAYSNAKCTPARLGELIGSNR